jgi:hypothetical protein
MCRSNACCCDEKQLWRGRAKGKLTSFLLYPPTMDTTADAASASLFASLHETAWHHIASYAAPPDVYNLCLSSVHFFHEGNIFFRRCRKKTIQQCPSIEEEASGCHIIFI